MTFLKLLLWPFSLLYAGITALRNQLYDAGMLKSRRFDIPVVAVGNLAVGGTGKTPHVEYLLRLLKAKRVAVLSRGYKRKSKGFVLAGPQATASQLGDEPFQYYRDYPDVTVAVCERRVEGMERLLSAQPELQVAVLDDAMQHRPIRPSLMLMLTDYTRPFYNDLVLPAGLLRESRHGAARADAVIVSKCPGGLSAEERNRIVAQIRRYSQQQAPVFFSTFRYGAPVAMGIAGEMTDRVILLTGIANASPLVQYLEALQYRLVHHLSYADHHHYTRHDLEELKQLVNSETNSSLCVVTTRKDAVKLSDADLVKLTEKLPIFYIPVEVDFLDKGDDFDHLILSHVEAFSA